jgi:Spy/CpxP family protein refolding chaperone
MTSCRFATLLPLALVLTFAVPAFAQEASPDAKRAQVEAKMKQIRDRMLREEVGLDEAKARQVGAILDQHQIERRALRQKLQAHRTALEELLRQDSNDQGAYSREIQALRETQAKIQALRNHEIDELQKVLSPKQQAQLGAATRRMKRRFRQAVRQHGAGGPPPR